MTRCESYHLPALELSISRQPLPRMIGAVLVGSALSLSGAAYQGVFKNPLVAPDLLGVSSGACVGASVAILLHLNSFGVQAMAFVAGILAVGLTLFIPRLIKNTNMTMLVLSELLSKESWIL